jgi:hypothetical protein
MAVIIAASKSNTNTIKSFARLKNTPTPTTHKPTTVIAKTILASLVMDEDHKKPAVISEGGELRNTRPGNRRTAQWTGINLRLLPSATIGRYPTQQTAREETDFLINSTLPA